MKTTKRSFVIVSPPYRPDNGGSMVLHYLCKLLNEQGHKAKVFLWFRGGDNSTTIHLFKDLFVFYTKRMAVWFIDKIYRKENSIKPNVWAVYRRSPIKTPKKFIPCVDKHTMVIYPEIISGNPLNASHVVRWLLQKPGFFTQKIDFGKDDLFFYYQEIFNDENLNPSKNRLTISYVKRDIYRQTNFGPHKGNCYIIRKGEKRNDLPKVFDGPIIDNLPDEDIAKIFNQCEYCISYDEYTMYSWYAAMCGCTSVVMPTPGVDKETWQPKEEFRYGVAYGLSAEELQHAKETKSDMEMFLQRWEDENVEQVQNFVSDCSTYFDIKK
jgi:hypothetical protein